MCAEQVAHESGRVLTCTAVDCSYNDTGQCLAGRVRIGAGRPRCETFSHEWVTPAGPETVVESCASVACCFNSRERCVAGGVTMSLAGGEPGCLTFRN
jgi:hypothetical protein